jgi:capsular polysaccharide biosynthesis protein
MNRNERDFLPAVLDAAPPPYYPPSFYAGEEEAAEESRLPLSQYFWVLKRHRWRIAGCVGAVLFATLLISARLTPIYEATTTVDIDRQSPSGVVGEEAARNSANDTDQFLATQIKLVESDAVLRPVDQRFELRRREGQTAVSTPRGEAAPVSLGQLKVTRPPNTYLMQISYRSADPRLAADAANAIGESYLEQTYEIRLRSSTSLAAFMERQIEELRAKMERSGQALAALERELNVMNPEEKTSILSARLLQLNIEYVPVPTPKGAVPELYFHFDSWRVHTGGAAWVPAQIYVEEEGTPGEDPALATPRFKAQSRIWDYVGGVSAKTEELTNILIESAAPVQDQETPKDVSPLESQRSWERQAEENLLARLEKGGFLARPGPVDEVLNTVLSNLIVSAKLGVEAHCRVLLTTPIETFEIGHTVVISRGLIDVLPDETSLALALAGELSHLALGHPTQTQFAFNNQTMLSDPELLLRFRFRRSPEEMRTASKKTIEIMRASPYRATANAGLFLKALAARSAALPRLLQANLGVRAGA